MVDSRDRIKSSRTVSPTSEIKLGDLYTIEMNRKCFGVGSGVMQHESLRCTDLRYDDA